MDFSVWVWIWLGVIVASALIEFLTMELLGIWFTVSGLVALVLALVGVGYEIQLIVFFILSVVLLFSLRKVCLKMLRKSEGDTNTSSILGKEFKLLRAISEDVAGSLKVNDVTWTAASEDGSSIDAGKYVIVSSIKGNKLIVKEKTKAEEK